MPLFLIAAVAVLLVAALLLERQAKRHEKLIERLLGEIVAVREDALVERASLLNRIAAPQVLQQITPTGQVSRAIERQAVAVAEEPDREQLELVGSIADGSYE